MLLKKFEPVNIEVNSSKGFNLFIRKLSDFSDQILKINIFLLRLKDYKF